MQNNRFVVLTGHLNNYPLSDLIGILRHQRKSGRLLIEYPKGPATLFFENGELVDVRLNELTGLQAICVLLSQPEAAFNFNPLIRSSQRSIEPSLQRVVSELFGCWDDSAIQIDSPPVRTPELNPASVNANMPQVLEGRAAEPLALPPAPNRSLGQRSFAMAALVLIVIGISTFIAVSGRLKQSESVFPTSQNRPETSSTPQIQPSQQLNVTERSGRRSDSSRSRSVDVRRASRSALNKQEEVVASPPSESTNPSSGTASQSEPEKQSANGSPATGAIKVVMQIENGRVLKASIANHAPGMDSFEALALRIARQRRYPASKTGAEAVTISVNKPD